MAGVLRALLVWLLTAVPPFFEAFSEAEAVSEPALQQELGEGPPGVLGYTRSEDGRYEAFVDGMRATLVLRDLRTKVTRKLIDRHLMLGERGSVSIFIGEDLLQVQVELWTHMTVDMSPFRVTQVVMSGR